MDKQPSALLRRLPFSQNLKIPLIAISILVRRVIVELAHRTLCLELVATTEHFSERFPSEMIQKKRVRRLVLACITLYGSFIASQLTNEHEFLTVDEAFPTEAELSDDGRVLARWVMPEGYYLYKHALKLVGKEGTELGSLVIPSGKLKTDEFFGEVEVYYNFLEISAPVVGQSQAEVVVDVHYQGCADAGLCYPPEVREFRFAGLGADIGIAPARNDVTPAGINIWVAIVSALLAGRILNLMPCVFPMLSTKALSIVRGVGEADVVRHVVGYLSGVVAKLLRFAFLQLVFRSFGVAVDWANREAEKTRLLEQFGRYGVPMYVLYPFNDQPVVLQQVLTPTLVRNDLAEYEDPST